MKKKIKKKKIQKRKNQKKNERLTKRNGIGDTKKIRKELISHNDIRVDEYYWLRDDTRSNKEVISYLEEENTYSEKWFAEKKDYKTHRNCLSF